MITLPGVNPVFMWTGFIALVLVFLIVDLAVFHRKNHAVSIKEALIWFLIWFLLAMLFNLWIFFEFGQEHALEFFTGYLIEKSLSMDNLFVFLMIFTAFSIPDVYQHRVLFWGIIGAIVMRGLFIGLGVALVEHFTWVFYLFGAVLIYAAYRMQFAKKQTFDPDRSPIVRVVRTILPVASELDHERFFTKVNGKRAITILFLTLLVIELTDVVFAFDSIPAIFGITTDPFIVFTSNIFAILGLRSLYFVLADLEHLFEHLKTGLAIILLFIGIKLIMKPLHREIPIAISLIFIVAVLLVSIFASIRHHHRIKRGLSPMPVTVRQSAPPKIDVVVQSNVPTHIEITEEVDKAGAVTGEKVVITETKGAEVAVVKRPRRRTATKRHGRLSRKFSRK